MMVSVVMHDVLIVTSPDGINVGETFGLTGCEVSFNNDYDNVVARW